MIRVASVSNPCRTRRLRLEPVSNPLRIHAKSASRPHRAHARNRGGGRSKHGLLDLVLRGARGSWAVLEA
eukprot:7856744-Pyramimonas_sp.AAC.1